MVLSCSWECSTPSFAAAAAAKSLHSCPTLCDHRDGSPPDSPVPGILQARTLEWVAISFSNAWKWKVKVKSLSRVRLLSTPWTAAHQAPLSMGFARQEYWSGMPSPSPTPSFRGYKFVPTTTILLENNPAAPRWSNSWTSSRFMGRSGGGEKGPIYKLKFRSWDKFNA